MAETELFGVPYYDHMCPDGWWVWDDQGAALDGPFNTEEEAESVRDRSIGEWVGEVIDGIRDESYWIESAGTTTQRLTLVYVNTSPKEDLGTGWICSNYKLMLGGRELGRIQHTPYDALFFPLDMTRSPVVLWDRR